MFARSEAPRLIPEINDRRSLHLKAYLGSPNTSSVSSRGISALVRPQLEAFSLRRSCGRVTTARGGYSIPWDRSETSSRAAKAAPWTEWLPGKRRSEGQRLKEPSSFEGWLGFAHQRAVMGKTFHPSVCKECGILFQPLDWLQYRAVGFCFETCMDNYARRLCPDGAIGRPAEQAELTGDLFNQGDV